MSSDYFQQGVEAFQAGDKVRARDLLLQATVVNPNNENAWYYLAAAETDNTLRRQYLERVLQLNPNHERAKQVLAKMDGMAAGGGSAAAAPVAAAPAPHVAPVTPAEPAAYTPPAYTPNPAPAANVPPATPIRPLDPAAGEIPGADPTSGFILPVTIPGAPPQVSPNSFFKGGWSLFQRGLDVLQRKAGVYEAEVGRATWWRFWLLVTFGYAINAVLTMISTLVVQMRFASLGFRFNFFAVLLSLILAIPIGMLTLYAGVYLSHWWAKRQGGQLPLYQHAYAIALPYIPASVIGTAIGVVLSLVGLGLGGFISLALSIYALYLIALGFENLYRFSDPNQKYITVAMMFIGFIVAGFVIGAITLAIFGFSAFTLG